MEIQILDDADYGVKWDAMNANGALYDLVHPTVDGNKEPGEWNHYRIVANNGSLRLHVNGREVSGGDEANYRKGYLGLESEGAPIEFRNIRIKELPSTGAGPVGELVGWTGCKGSTGLSAPPKAEARAAGTECVEYEYDGRSVLRLKHVDAGFNCCPGTISADIDIDGREILITERESSSLCDCNCLFDVNYEIVAVAPGVRRCSGRL
jgi:hypothetical protein